MVDEGILASLNDEHHDDFFIAILRHDFAPVLPFVADYPQRRNNSKKNPCNSLDSAENRHTFALAKTDSTAFATSKVEVRI